MSLKLMYITNNTEVAKIAEQAGVERIFVDLEYIGKAERQRGRDTVLSDHTVEDVKRIKKVLHKTQLLVRVNSIHKQSEEEINAVIEAGADLIMLPYFKTVEEVKEFLNYVNGRSKAVLLVETPEAVGVIDEILALSGIDELFIGLNDMSIGYKKKFMFELLVDGTVEYLCKKFKASGIPYGFGGIASIGKGMLPSDYIIKEHYRLESSSVILSRSFCNVNQISDLAVISEIFTNGVTQIREFEKKCENEDLSGNENLRIIAGIVDTICRHM